MTDSYKIFLLRIEWTENKYVRSSVYLTRQKNMTLATKWMLTKFKQDYPSVDDCRITWVENISSELRDRWAVLIYSDGPHGVHDPFCSSNRGQT